MGSVNAGQSVLRNTHPRAQGVAARINWQTLAAGLLAFVLVASPRTRTVLVAPIYLIDVLAILLLFSPLKGSRYSWVPSQPFSQIVIFYMALLVLSELRGMIAYGALLEPVYMIGRFIIASSVFFVLPRLIASRLDMIVILKGLVLGTLVSSIIVIMYSVGPLRPLVVNTIYSMEFLNPGWGDLLRAVEFWGAGEVAMRGISLVGAATFTAGFLATTWPLAFLAYEWFDKGIIWKRLALATTVTAPVGILMTYGRGAWQMVAAVVALIAAFGMASTRKITLLAILAGVILFTQFNVDPSYFYMERIIQQTQKTLDSPFADVSTAERLLSFVQPFGHLAENPFWFLVGAGRAGEKLALRTGLKDTGGQLYDEGGLATHSGFAMAYYSFGFMAAICQVLLIANGFLFILARMRARDRASPDQRLVWHSMFLCWVAYSMWWASGHAMVGAPRGLMLSFFMYGLLVSFEKLDLMSPPARRLAHPPPRRK